MITREFNHPCPVLLLERSASKRGEETQCCCSKEALQKGRRNPVLLLERSASKGEKKPSVAARKKRFKKGRMLLLERSASKILSYQKGSKMPK
jgi:hypothetical protein